MHSGFEEYRRRGKDAMWVQVIQDKRERCIVGSKNRGLHR
jgi:hypothetical protein